MKRITSALIAALALGAGGCATAVHGTRQKIDITSDPPGARIEVVSGASGAALPVPLNAPVTPATLKLPRKNAHLVIRLTHDGCLPLDIPLKRSVSGWVAANGWWANPFAAQGADSPEAAKTQYAMQVFLVTPAAFALDFASGGAYTLPRRVDGRLCRERATEKVPVEGYMRRR